MKLDSFVTQSERKIYYRFQSGVGTPLVFLNGLSDDMHPWMRVVDLMHTKRPKIFVDLLGQGLSLEDELKNHQENEELHFDYQITIEQQTEVLCELLQFLNVRQYGLVGFSYGGGIALNVAQQHPDDIKELILIAPFLLRLDLAFPMSRFWVWYFKFLKFMTPQPFKFPFSVLEKSYSQFVHQYMHYRYSTRIQDNLRREIAIRLSEGIMRYNVFENIKKLPEKKLQLVSCDMDTLIPKSLMYEFWYRLHASKRLTWTRVSDGEHLLLEQNKYFVAKLVEDLLTNHHDQISSIRFVETRHYIDQHLEPKPNFVVSRAQI